MAKNSLKARIGAAAFTFRGYNITNLGRSAELLRHAVYGPTVERYLREAGDICASVVGRNVDLVDRVRREEETSLHTYDEAISLIAAMCLAHIRLLEEFFGIAYRDVRMAYGYSLGELTALVASGVYELQHAMRVPLSVAADCVAMAEGVTMGVLFSRGPVLDLNDVQRLCLRITAEGRGVIAMSAYLAPNPVLVLGQGPTIDRFSELMHDVFPDRVYLRKNNEHWPPMHTPLVWRRNINTRAGIMMHTLPGGMRKPDPPIFSLVTGKMDYTDTNARAIIYRWVDQPQRLWDAVYETLATGIKTVVHVGPDPNLIPATYQRLSDNVNAQLSGYSPSSLGLRAMAVARPWLTAVLPSRTALLRAPLVEHIILEDWLIEHQP